MKHRFPVQARIDKASVPEDGIVEIDRQAGVFAVRAKRGRTYTLPLAEVATLVAQAQQRAEVALNRKPVRRVRRGAL